MKYTSINIQGNLISEEILQKIENSDIQGQQSKDFGFDPGINLRSEIEFAWSKVKLDWKYFFERTEKLPASDPYGTTLSRRWMTSFFSTLGFELTLQKTSLLGDNQQLYSISHVCEQLDGFPFHIVGFYDPSHPDKNTLDIRSSGGTSRLSPHATIQEYLNVTEYSYSMASNGLVIRLIRDSGRLVRMTYIEFDLKRLLEEDKYSEFTLLYRLLHASRFPKSKQETEECFIEKYYQDSIESGNRIRNGLSDAVKESLVALGNGLLEHPGNEELREKISHGRPDGKEFYHQLLRLIYRLLFLMVTEERDLVFPEIQSESREPDINDLLNGIKRPTKKQKEIYYNFYSLSRLRRLSQKRYLLENQYSDLWQGLMQTFSLFETSGTGNKLGILALGSELFSSMAMPDISLAKVSNRILLQCIRSLNEFEDEKHNLSFINYRALDVEELGSVYEGLLELEPLFVSENGSLRFTFKKGSERSKSGSHYTPEDLVKPLIQHSLEYLIEERVADFYKGKSNKTVTKKKLIDLKVCDVACGSGHILLSAARRIALEVARVETGEQQPNPASFRHSLKEVIKNCIYGVDKNPLAVELCKVALWLESHNPGEPLSFLDHRIKCGDAIVGLAHRKELQNGMADEAFKKLPGDDKDVASTFLKKNRQERTIREKSRHAVQLTTETDHKLMEQVKELNRLIENFSNLLENTPEEIERKEKAYRILVNSNALRQLKIMADLQIMPFFLPKTEANKDLLLTDAQYFRYLRGEARIPDTMDMKAIQMSVDYRFFHWFLEFPEVLIHGGFDCILGNPPYLGGSYIATNFGPNYFELLKAIFQGTKGRSDLIAYFLRRIHNLVNVGGFFSLISTNSISQGETAEGSLKILLEQNCTINFAKTNISWPGIATVTVHIISIFKGHFQKRILNNAITNDPINYLLKTDSFNLTTYPLKLSSDIAFKGTSIYGDGFVLTQGEKDKLISEDNKNNEVIFKYLGGRDVNEIVDSIASRYVINFFDWDKEKAEQFKIPFAIVTEKVKPYREKVLKSSNQIHEFDYWKYWDKRLEHYRIIANFDRVLVLARVNKVLAFVYVSNKQVFSDSLVVFKENSVGLFAVLQSNMHFVWIINFFTTQGSTPVYIESKVLNNFPLCDYNKKTLNETGRKYHENRHIIMHSAKLGLTRFYNAFHSKEASERVISENLMKYDKKTIEKQFGKEVWNLWNHLQKNSDTCSFEEAVKGIIKLRELHVEMDNAVLEAYGWQDINLRHDFYEVDYLPENDRIRFTIHPDARKEVLKRLLELNHKIHEEEVKAGLWDEKKTKKRKTVDSDSNGDQVSEPEVGYGGLFG